MSWHRGRWATIALVIVAASSSCASPRTPPPAAAPRATTAPPPAYVEAAPADACAPTSASAKRSGPAHVWLPGDGMLRVEATGATLIPAPNDKPTWVDPGVNGEAWLYNADGLWVLEPTSATLRRVAPAPPRGKAQEKWLYRVAARSPRDVWAIAMEGEVATSSSTDLVHFDGERWTTIDPTRFLPPGAEKMGFPIELAATDHAVWLTASNAVWLLGEGDWKRVEAERPDAFFPMSSRIVLQRRDGHHEVRDEAGREVPLGDAWKSRRMLRALDPTGVAVFAEEGAPWIGALDGSCTFRIQGLRGRAIRSVDIDDRRRVWLATDHGLLIVDHRGSVLADFMPGTLPGFDTRGNDVAVAFAGPDALPAAKSTPRRVDIVGHLRVGSRTPIVGARAEIRVGTDFVRESVTDDAGTFRLQDVPEGVYSIELHRSPATKGCPPNQFMREYYAMWTASMCDGTASGATCDMGELRPCVPMGP